MTKYKRILLKISGESLMGDKQFGYDDKAITKICHQIKEMQNLGVEICIVVGGGNIFRGVRSEVSGVDRITGDYMGMLATVMNGLALQSILEKDGIETRMLSAIPMNAISEPYIKRRAIRHIEKGRAVIFTAGTGNPFFTTDTTAVLRASEMGCDVVLKATLVDGVYSADPKKDKNATHHARLSYSEVVERDLRAMDLTAITLAKDNNIPIIVFSILQEGIFTDILKGIGKFTLIE